jgi:signal transduction histidine kinase
MEDLISGSRSAEAAECPDTSALERLAAAAVIVDENDRVVFANGEAARFLGIENILNGDAHREELVGFHDLVHSQGCDEEGPCLLREALRRGAVVRYEEDCFHCEGQEARAVYFSVSPYQDRTDRVVVLFGDISDYRKNQAYLLAMDRMVAVGTLAAGMAHEINNPLAFVRSNVDYARRALQTRQGGDERERTDEPDDRDLSEALSDALDGLDRVHAIVEGMRVFVDDGAAIEYVDAEHCLSNALVVCRGRLEQVADVGRQGPKLGRVWGNEARLARVFVNLLCNAADAIEESRGQGRIEVVTGVLEEEGEPRQFVEIIDDAEGIAEEDQKRIFDPFFTHRDAGGGTGLGLYISQNFVAEMKGTLTVRSQPGKGSVFRVELPLGK